MTLFQLIGLLYVIGVFIVKASFHLVGALTHFNTVKFKVSGHIQNLILSVMDICAIVAVVEIILHFYV